jgi:CRP/FNR family transcriptional regulator, cyclic AMP receptor protein
MCQSTLVMTARRGPDQPRPPATAAAAWPPGLPGVRRPAGEGPPASRAGLMSRIDGTPSTVLLLDVEPDLGHGIGSQDWEIARQATRTMLTRIDRREFTLSTGACDTSDVIGLIVNDGTISRELALGEHVAFELLTPGDVLLLPAAGPDGLDLGGRVTLTALSPAELIVLGRAFIHAAALAFVVDQFASSPRGPAPAAAIQALAAHLPRAEDRLLLTLWGLADSCGRVTSEGTVLPRTKRSGASPQLADPPSRLRSAGSKPPTASDEDLTTT